MPVNIRMISTYPPRRCGIATFCRDLTEALESLNNQIDEVRIAAIENSPKAEPRGKVDIIIDQYNPDSWKLAAGKILDHARGKNNPTAVVLQHEYGLDPDPAAGPGRGDHFVQLAKTFTDSGLTCVVYLHTLLENPNEHQRRIIQQLARYSDGLIVTTEGAIDILESEAYGISPFKLKHIDHGVRMQHPTQFDRYEIKQQWNLSGVFLALTLGLLSPGKGIQYSLPAWSRFLHESCTPFQREHLVYLIAGQYHPEFVKDEGGRHWREYVEMIRRILKESGLTWCRTKDLAHTDWAANDVVFYDRFLDEETLLKLYGAANVMILPYLNMEQISSGILADTIGSGRVAIATKFRYATELIHSSRQCPPGLLIGRYSRGILVDPGPDCVPQIAEALDFLVFEGDKRLRMERQAHQRGYQMRWANSAWALMQYLDFISEEKRIPTGRGMRFVREKPSPLQRHYRVRPPADYSMEQT